MQNFILFPYKNEEKKTNFTNFLIWQENIYLVKDKKTSKIHSKEYFPT
jgi:hypothetical protein